MANDDAIVAYILLTPHLAFMAYACVSYAFDFGSTTMKGMG
jgi:hypothetical protein